jgi:hypothetical protein
MAGMRSATLEIIRFRGKNGIHSPGDLFREEGAVSAFAPQKHVLSRSESRPWETL